MKRTSLFAFVALAASCLHIAALPPKVVELRNLGYAELENEQPAKAEEHYRQLIALAPDDPLGHANLAIAALRQQNFDRALEAIDQALAIDSESAQLLAIKGEILQWSGSSDDALPFYQRAAAAAPADVELQYALYRHLTTVLREPDPQLVRSTLEALVALRPENALVLLQQGRLALADGDRATASGAYLRLGELIWQAPTGSDRLHQAIVDALEANDLAAARLPSQRLENVLKITPMYREGLRELSTGIQGIPLKRLRGEGDPTSFGSPAKVRFAARKLAPGAGFGASLAVGDFDGDQRPDLVRVTRPGGTGLSSLDVRLNAPPPQTSDAVDPPPRADGIRGLLAADIDNDGFLDLLGYGSESFTAWRGDGQGRLVEATDAFGLAKAAGTAAEVIDFDIEGDLDLVLVGNGVELWRNNLAGPLEAVGDRTLPQIENLALRAVVASDLDRDGDLDLVLASDRGLHWFDNLRQGRFVDRSAGAGLDSTTGAVALAAADLDGDGLPELIAAGKGIQVLHNDGGSFSPWSAATALGTSAEFAAVAPFDADNDGRLDLAVAGDSGVAVAAQRDGRFEFLVVEGSPTSVSDLDAVDFDGDGDVDLIAHGAAGLHVLDNEGGNANRWLTVRLRGLTKGNSKNNIFGVGSVVEVRAGDAYQFREARGDSVHFGLGSIDSADLLRVVWTNGVPQNRLAPELNQWVVEEQLLKGSCPFVYILADGEVRFVTDLLWNAPAGLPLAPGVWAPADPSELVKLGSVEPIDGRWDLRITEELWEAAFFDKAKLWVVDHPADIEVASSLKVAPGEAGDDRVLATRTVEPVAAAWDTRGRDVTEVVRLRDEVYADGWSKSPYQGVASEHWAFTFDLGRAPNGPVRLLLDGWIFPADASLNLAVAQRDDLSAPMPRLEVETAAGWQPLIEVMGHPAGKTKTMVVDTPPLPAGARNLRIVSGQWLSWDRIAWSEAPADQAARVVAKLDPTVADLRFRGFSAVVRQAPNAPHTFDYAKTRTQDPWIPFPGNYTKYGDVRELLATADDRSVIMAPGDEMHLLFDATDLPKPPPGWQRTLFLESHGWDKDADRNTFEGQQMEPLPFRAMQQYGEPFPRSEELDAYRQEWLTRSVPQTNGDD